MLVYTKNTIISGFRSNSFRVLILLTFILMFLVWLSASFSARQPQTLTLDLGISAIRFLAITLSLFWVQELFAKDIEQKTVIFALSYPASRTSYLFGKFIGIIILLFLAIVVMAIILLLMIKIIASDYVQATPVDLGEGYIFTIIYLWLSIASVAAFTIFVACISTVPMLSFILGIGFAIGASLIGPTFDYIVKSEPANYESLLPVIEKLFWLLPDLSRLDIRDWTLYGQNPDVGLLFYGPIVIFVYSAMMLLLANMKFCSREFT